MNALTDLTPEAVEAAQQAEHALEAAKSYPAIASPEQHQAAGGALRDLKVRKTALEDMRVDLKKPILEAGRKIDEFFKKPMQLLEEAERAIKKQISAYESKMAEQRREAERLAAVAAQRERERLQAEAAKREEEARREREKSEARARELEEKGKAERAEALRQQSAEKAAAKQSDADALRLAAHSMPTAPVVVMPESKVEGISSRDVWSAELTDKMALIKAVAEGAAPADLVEVNMPLANKLARALKAGFQYAGLRAVSTKSVAVRA